jgi:DNA-binding CsgD family transcriptional regulator/tetratricopeptide (TPR) repeat protein
LLAERGLDEEAAEHAVKADLAGDPAAIAVLHRVGQAARSSGATDSAISILESAVALAGDQASAELLCDFTELLAAGGRPADGKEVGQRVLQLADLPVKIRVRTLEALARAHLFLGEYQAATQRADECVDLAVAVDPEFAVGLLFSYARGINFIAGQAAALPILDRARTVARECDPPFRWSAEVGWAYAALVTGDSSGLAGAEGAARAVEAAAATASGRALLVGTGALATYATIARLTDRLAESEHFFRARLRCAEEAGSPEEVGATLFALAGTLQRMLRLGEGLAMAERCAGLADLVPLLAPYAAADRANLLLLSGCLAESEESARRTDDLVRAMGGWQPSLNLAYGRAWRYLAEGRLGDACALYEHIEATAKGAGVREPCDVPWARHAMAAYLGSGRRGDAERVLTWLEDCAQTLPCRYPRIAIAHGRALLAEDGGDETTADGLFQQAMAIHEEVDLPLERLVTLLEYGRFLRRAGQPQRARPLLAQATAVAEAAGADWLAGQASQELRVAGGRRREKADPNRMTPQEERVAALAASGASNAEIAGTLFLSVNTVETHLQHIYVKLGVRSRLQLAAALAARSALP